MLGVSDAKTIEEIWDIIESKAVLPSEAAEFFTKSGPKREFDVRNYERHYLRCRGVVRDKGQNHAVYLKDCSRSGMGFISPIQLFPRDRVELWTEMNRSYELEVTRCRRIKPNCYECGSIYILG